MEQMPTQRFSQVIQMSYRLCIDFAEPLQCGNQIWAIHLLCKVTTQVKLSIKERNVRPTNRAKTYRLIRATIYNLAKETA